MKCLPYSFGSVYEEDGGYIIVHKELPGGQVDNIKMLIAKDGEEGMRRIRTAALREAFILNLRHRLAFGWWDQYFATLDRNGTEDEITVCAPDGRPMLCVAFWDAEYDDDPAKDNADRLKADAVLIVRALNLRHWLTAPARWMRPFFVGRAA
jgi:hypothetical protein